MLATVTLLCNPCGLAHITTDLSDIRRKEDNIQNINLILSGQNMSNEKELIYITLTSGSY